MDGLGPIIHQKLDEASGGPHREQGDGHELLAESGQVFVTGQLDFSGSAQFANDETACVSLAHQPGFNRRTPENMLQPEGDVAVLGCGPAE
jgi:hypothetical protein